MRKPPAFQFYAKDWRSSPSIRKASYKDRGILAEIMALSWEFDPQGVIPLSEEEICRELGVETATLRRLYVMFTSSLRYEDGKLIVQKLKEQGDKYREISEKRSSSAHQRHANAATVHPTAVASAVAVAFDGWLEEGKEEGTPPESIPSEVQSSAKQQQCKDCSRPPYTCYKHNPIPAKPRTPTAAPPMVGTDRAKELCDYAVKALNKTGIPRTGYPQEWVTDADKLLSFNDDPSVEGMQILKDCFLFARLDPHFGKYTAGIPDFVRFYMNDADKGLKFKFWNSRRKAENEPSNAPSAKQPKFKGEII